VGARSHLILTNLDDVMAPRDLLPHGFVIVQMVTALVDIGQLDGLAKPHLASIGALLGDQHPEQSGLTGAVGADDTDNSPGRDLEAQIIDEQTLAIALDQVVGVDDEIAQPRGRWYVDLVGFGALLESPWLQVVELAQGGLALGLPAVGVAAHPLELMLDRLALRRLRACLLRQA